MAMGPLEALWHVTAEQAADGGIGRLSDSDIAEEMFYSGDPAALIAALVESGFIDLVEGCRLYVHDWHEHCPDHIHNRLFRANKSFANGSAPNPTRMSAKERERVKDGHNGAQQGTPCAQDAPPCALERTNQAQPGPTQPNPTKPKGRLIVFGNSPIDKIKAAYAQTAKAVNEVDFRDVEIEIALQDLSDETMWRDVIPGLENYIAEILNDSKDPKWIQSPVNFIKKKTWEKYRPRDVPGFNPKSNAPRPSQIIRELPNELH